MNKKMIVWILVVAALLAIAYFGYKYFKNKRDQELLMNTTAQGTTPAVTSSGGSGYSDEFPLKVGSRGANVLAAQIALNKACNLYGKTLTEDGVYGPLTSGAVNICLAGKNGHIDGQLTYAEFVYLKNKATGTGTSTPAVSTAGSVADKIAEGCKTSTGKLFVEAMYGIKCSDFGYNT